MPSYRSAISAVTFVVHDGLVTRWSGKVAQATTAGITKEVVTGVLDPLIAMLAGPDSAKIRGGLTSELASASGFSSPRTQGKAFQFWMEVESAEKPAYARAEINALPAKASPTDLVSGCDGEQANDAGHQEAEGKPVGRRIHALGDGRSGRRNSRLLGPCND